MFEFDIGNEEFIRWLLSCDQRKRKRLVSKVQKQLAQMGVSGESMRRALEQLSQDPKVYVQKFTLEEIRMYTQWNADLHWRREPRSADSRGYSERENYYHQRPQYRTSNAHSHRYRSREDHVDRHMRKELYRRKRKMYSDHDSDGRRHNVCDRKMRRVEDEKQNIKSVISRPVNNLISELKDNKKVESEVEKERLSSSKVNDSVACSGIKTNVTGMACTSETSNLGEQTHSSAVKGTDRTETVVPYESVKDCNIKEKESEALIDVNGKVGDSGNERVQEEGVTAYKVQSFSTDGGKVLTSRKRSGIEEDEHHSFQRELIPVVNRVTAEVNPEKNALEKDKSYCVISEAEHHSDSKPKVVSNEEVSPVRQETKETSDASNESHGNFLGNHIQTRHCLTGRNCTDDEGTKDSASRTLSKKAETSEHETRKSHTLSTDFNDNGVNVCEKAEYSSVSSHKCGIHEENASVQYHTGSGGGVAGSKTRMAEVGKTVGESLGESKHADKSGILDNQRTVSMHVSSKHEGLECSQLKLQQSQQDVGSTVTTEEVSHQGRKLQVMVPEIKEASHVDNMKYKTVHGNFHSNKKGRDTVVESATLEKTLKREVKSSEHLVSKEKCGMDQPDSSMSNERKKNVKSVPKYPGVRRTSSQYYTTIDEYFGKNYIEREDENNHNTKDSAKNLGNIECAVNNQHQLVCENKFPVVSMNLEKSDEVIKTNTSSTKQKEKSAKVSTSEHTSKWTKNVKRRSSEASEFLSKIHKKRRFSYGGEESAVFGISVDKGSEVRPVGNDMKTRKNDDKMLETDIPELPKRGEQADAYGVSTANGTRMIPGGTDIFKTRRKKVTKQGKRSPHGSKVEQAATQGVHIEKVTKMKPEENVVKNKKNEETVLEKESLHCSKTKEQDAVRGVSTERGTKANPTGTEIVKRGKDKENTLRKKSSHCVKTSQQASTEGVSIEGTTKIITGGCEIVKTRVKVENTLKASPQHLETEEQDAVQSLSTEKTTKLKPGGSERVKTGKDEERILKESQRCLKTGQQATSQVISIEKAMKIKPRGSEIVNASKNKGKILKESPHCLKTKEQAAVLDLSMEKTIKMKPGAFEMVKTGKKVEKVVKGPQNLERGKQTAARSISMEKDTNMKPKRCDMLNAGRKEEKILKGSPQRLKPGQQAAAHGVSTKKGIQTKDEGNEIAKRRNSREKTRVTLNQRGSGTTEVKTAAYGVSKQKVHNNTASELEPRGNELLVKESNVKVYRRERQYHSFDSLNNCKRGKNDTLFSEKQNRRNTSEDIANTNPFRTSKLDLKLDKYEKKREIMLELFGEDPDEPSGSKSNTPDGVYMKVLQEHYPSAISAKVSDLPEENVKYASSLEQDNRQKDNGSRCHLRTFSYKSESERNSLIKGAVQHSDQQQNKGFGDHESSSLCPRSEVQKAGSLKLIQFIDSVQQNNHKQEDVCDSMKDRSGADTALQNNEDQSSSTTHKNDLYVATPITAAIHADTSGESNHQKDTGPEGRYESELPITCPMKEGTGTVSQNNTEKHNEFGHQKSSDIHLTGSIKEGENGEFHLIINSKNIDTLFPSPQKDHSCTTTELLPVNNNILKGINDGSDGHSVNMKGVVHAEKCIENANVPSDTAERVAEKRVAPPEANVNVSTSDIPEVPTLCSKITGSVDKHVSPVPHKLCCEQNEPDNQHHTVERSSTHEPSQDLVLLSKGGVQDSSSQSQIFGVSTSVTKETEVVIAGKEKCLSESNSMMRVDGNKGSCNFPQSTVDPDQTQLCTTLQANISNSKETTSAMDGSRPAIRSDQLQPESFLPNSESTDDESSHGIKVSVSHTLPRIRVRDPESLGIARPEKSFFKDMDTKLCELTEVTYVLLQDMTRIVQRHRALCRLTGTLKDTEAALAKAEYTTHHQIVKAKTFLDLYKYVERSFSDESKDILIKRLSELNPDWPYTSEHLEKCRKYCIWVLRNSPLNLENLGSTSSQVTALSVPFLQQILQQKFQHQPVGVPASSNVACNTNNQVLSLLQARGQIPPSSEANINSKQQSSESVQNVTSIAPVLCTSSRKEMVTHTGGPATNPTYDLQMREMGSNLNPRHVQTVNIPQQPLPNYNLVQTQNLSGRQFMYSNSNSYIQPVHETDRTLPLVQGQVLNNPPKNGTIPRLPPHSYGVQHTTPSAVQTVQNVNVPYGNRSVASGFLGSVPVSGSSYSPQNSSSHSYAPNLQVAPSHYTSKNRYHQNQAIQQGTLAYHLSKDVSKNTGSSRVIHPSNQNTQHIVNKNAALNKSVPKSANQPYPRNEAIQQDTFFQPVSNTLQNTFTPNSSNQLYPRNEAIEHRTLSYPPNALQQGSLFHYMNNAALLSSAPNSSSRPYVPNKVINQGMFSHQVSNDVPSNIVTGCARSVSLLESSTSTAGPMRDVHGYVHPIGNSFYPPPPPPYVALSSSYTQPLTQVTPQAQKQVSVREHHAPSAQGNTGSYNGVSSGFPQQHQAPPAAAELQMQLCGTPQSVGHRQGSHGRRNANDVASNNYADGGITQNAPASNNFFYMGNNQNVSPGNNIVNNRLSEEANSQSRSLVNSAADNTLSNCRNTWSEPASNVCDKRKTQCEPASNSVSDRGKNHYLSADSVGCNSLFDRINNLSGTVPNRTADNGLSDKENNQSVSLARRNNQSRHLPNRTEDNLCGREKNQTGSLPNSTSNRLSDRGNSWSGPPASVNIPSSVTFQARLEGVHQHSNRPAQKLPISELGQQNVNNITQKHLSGAASYPSTENRNVHGKNGLFELHTISEATPLEDPQLEINSNIAETPASLLNSQIVFTVNQQSSLCRSQQRQLSSIVTAQPALSKNTPVVAVQASGNPSHVPNASVQATGISSTGHSAETLHLHVCEPLSTNHVTLSATVSEAPEKAVPDQQSTNNTLRTGIQQATSDRAALRTYRRRTGNYNQRDQPGRVEVVDFRNDVQFETESECLGTEVGGSEDTPVVANISREQDKCDISNRIPEKHSISNHSTDPKTGLVSIVAGKEGNSKTVEVISKQSEEQEITILTVEECVPMSNSESSQSSSLNKIPTNMVEEAGGSDNSRVSDSEVELLYEVLPQSRTVSRDSGYKTPSPMAGDVSIINDQKEIPVEKLDFQLTENMYQPEDKLRMSEEDEESKPLLEEEFEDYKDSKLLTWFECEDAVSATWCDTEETLLTWHESEVAVVREKTSVIQCAVCEKPAEVKCSGCLVTCYCSAECQLEDWNTSHHTVCCAALDD